MALQSSGVISLQDIQDEFDGEHPIGISEYYGVDTVPASGAISLSDFYGTSNAVFIAATGGSIVTSGDYKIHTFTGSGTFTVTTAGNAAGSNTVQFVGIAGGGGGGSNCGGNGGGGGGGAGGYRSSVSGENSGGGASALSAYTVSAQDYPISIGGGGTGQTGCGSGTAGSGSSAFGYSMTGGGRGGGHYANGGTEDDPIRYIWNEASVSWVEIDL